MVSACTKDRTVADVAEIIPLEEDNPNGRLKYGDPIGGILMVDEENIAAKVIKELASKIGGAIVTG